MLSPSEHRRALELVAELQALLAPQPRTPDAADAARAAEILPRWFSAFGAGLVTVAEAREVRCDTALGQALAKWSAEEHEGDAARTAQALGLLLRNLARCGSVAGFTVERMGREAGASIWRVSPSPAQAP
jgi:hypothetical protein